MHSSTPRRLISGFLQSSPGDNENSPLSASRIKVHSLRNTVCRHQASLGLTTAELEQKISKLREDSSIPRLPFLLVVACVAFLAAYLFVDF
ncbi:hypothetical protein P9112_005488 [Eukaryota sp. TZLM1-RC]